MWSILGHPTVPQSRYCTVSRTGNTLCEKLFTVTGAEAREVFAYARLKQLLGKRCGPGFPGRGDDARAHFHKRVLGDVHRLPADLSTACGCHTPTCRIRNTHLMGRISWTWASITYARVLEDEGIGKSATASEAKSFMTIGEADGVDHVGSILLKYQNGRHAVLNTSNHVRGPLPFSPPRTICEGLCRSSGWKAPRALYVCR